MISQLKLLVYLILRFFAVRVNIKEIHEICVHENLPLQYIEGEYIEAVYVSVSSAHDRSRLRLAASCGLLKLAQSSHYHDLISPSQFQRLALCIQVHRLTPNTPLVSTTLLLPPTPPHSFSSAPTPPHSLPSASHSTSLILFCLPLYLTHSLLPPTPPHSLLLLPPTHSLTPFCLPLYLTHSLLPPTPPHSPPFCLPLTHPISSAESLANKALIVVQDTCDEVRDGFVSSLHQGLRSLKLPLAYLESVCSGRSGAQAGGQGQTATDPHLQRGETPRVRETTLQGKRCVF